MKNLTFTLLSLIFFISCTEKKDNLTAFTIGEKDLIPEGIAYSDNTGNFYLGSINKNKIIEIQSSTGEYTDFYEFEEGTSVIGIMVDQKRNHLWACANRDAEGMTFASVSKIDLESSHLICVYIRTDTANLLFNDITITSDGNSYLTNSSAQTIYWINPETNKLDTFFDSPEISYPNGITHSEDESKLYIASWNKGIRILDINSRSLIGSIDTTHNSLGLDGIKMYQNSIIGIQNAAPNLEKYKVNRYYLNNSGTQITHTEIVAIDNPHFDAPTTAVIRDNEVFVISNSQLGTYNRDKTLSDKSVLNDNIISSYVLK